MSQEIEVHSPIGPSKSERWMNCPGSVKASEGCPDSCNDAATLGTAAHKLGELTLLKGAKSPKEWERPAIVEAKGKPVKVDEDMCAAVGVYTEYVWGRIEQAKKRNPNVKLATELRFDLTSVHPQLFGINDCLIDCPLNFLEIIDYKHGTGHVVEIVEGDISESGTEITCGGKTYYVENGTVFYPDIKFVNTQLLIYALGALLSRCDLYSIVFLSIVQPRAEHQWGAIRTVALRPSVILKWGEEVLKPAAAKCFEENPEYKRGSWCRFCPAGNTYCPATARQFEEALQLEQPLVEISKPVVFPLAKDLTPVQLGNLYQFAQHFKTWADGLTAFMHQQLATGAMTSATLGYKRVKGNEAKSWSENYKEVIIEKSEGLVVEDDFYGKAPVLSPNQLDKRLQEKGLAKSARDKIINNSIVKTPGNPRLVPVSAAGQELPIDTQSAFQQFETGE